jgi:hypothetical protein
MINFSPAGSVAVTPLSSRVTLPPLPQKPAPISLPASDESSGVSADTVNPSDASVLATVPVTSAAFDAVSENSHFSAPATGDQNAEAAVVAPLASPLQAARPTSLPRLLATLPAEQQTAFSDRLRALNPAEQRIARTVGTMLLQTSPPPSPEALRTEMSKVSPERAMEIGRTLNTARLYLPSLSPRAPGAEDASTRLQRVEMPFAADIQAGYVQDMAAVAQQEGFQLNLQVESTDADGMAFAAELSHTAEGASSAVTVTETARAGYEWGEDNKALAQNGDIIVPPDADSALERAKRFAQADIGRGPESVTSQGVHTATLNAYDTQGLVERSVFQGEVSSQNAYESAIELAAATGRNVRQARTFNEGGNLLVGTLPNGEAYGVIGKDGLLTSTFLLTEQFEADPATVPEFAPEPFNAQRATMGLDRAFEDFTPEQQDLVQETAMRLNNGKQEITDADREAAVTFLVRTELTRPVFAEDLGIAPENLVFVDQPDFHIDMYMRPMAPGQMMLNDFDANDRLLQDALSRSEPGSWEARELEGMITRNREIETVLGPVTARIAQQLEAGGLEVVKAPGVLEGPVATAFDTDYMNSPTSARNETRYANFMNGVPATRPGSNEQIYLTNASSLGPLQEAYGDYMRTQGIEQVYFLGANEGGDGAPNLAEISLIRRGGLDCREAHLSLFQFSTPPQR